MGFTDHCTVKAHKEAGRAAKDDEISMEEFLRLAKRFKKQTMSCCSFLYLFVIGAALKDKDPNVQICRSGLKAKSFTNSLTYSTC